MKLRPRAEVFCFKRNQVLCGFRKDYVVFPGGGIDPSESAKQAAIRECAEEGGRRLINCTVAHPPTTQIWAPEYQKSRRGKDPEDYEGSYTYWMTGSTSRVPVPPPDRHADYEPTMDWHPVSRVIVRLQRELKGDWADDVKVRIKVLETHLEMQRKHAEAGAESTSEAMTLGEHACALVASIHPRFPVLHASPRAATT
jgi:8-oxo-dGTP pyrophosphatase MutT (NUDIX family)